MVLSTRGNAKILFIIALVIFGAEILFAPKNNLLAVADAQNTIVEARVTSVSGKAAISGNGLNNANLLRGVTLTTGDVISTGSTGHVVIDLTDGSQVIILPNSKVVVSDFRNAATLRELLQITLGRIRVRINHFQGKPNPYRVKSPTASIAVRGTEFEVSVGLAGETRVTVLKGKVEVASLSDPSRLLLAEPGRSVIVRPDETIDFFVSGMITKGTGERGDEKSAKPTNRNEEDKEAGLRDAANVYERYLESVVESGKSPLPSRFAAFPDAHLDSLENPAYAAEFTAAEGRLFLLPSLNGVSSENDEIRDRFGLKQPRPLDYGIIPEGTFFAPLNRFRMVIGGSAAFTRDAVSSASISENVQLPNPQFPTGTTGMSDGVGSTSNNILKGSLIVARRFGNHDQRSFGVGVERLSSHGFLNETTNLTDSTGLSFTEQVKSHTDIDRTRLTFGFKEDFRNVRLGLFYRHNLIRAGNFDEQRLINGIRQSNSLIDADGKSSEVGLRLRGAISSRLFYGAEGTLLFGHSRENIKRAVIVDSNQHAATNRATLGFGIGYIFRPRTIFSIDTAAGLVYTNQYRNEVLTGNQLEREHLRARFVSFHAAAQSDLWRNLFISTSLLSITQSRTTDSRVFPDRFGRLLNAEGFVSSPGRTRDYFTDFYSNYGLGWRFKPNFVVEYILTTDYGQTSARHGLLLRYTFDFNHK